MSALYTQTSDLLEIKNHNLDGTFVDTWIDSIEDMAQKFTFSKIRTLSLEHVLLDDRVAYDIFHDFPNITELRVLNSRFTSRGLNNLLTYLNPYSLGRLDLTGSLFESFDVNDFGRISGLISIGTLTLPNNMDSDIQKEFKKVIHYSDPRN